MISTLQVFKLAVIAAHLAGYPPPLSPKEVPVVTEVNEREMRQMGCPELMSPRLAFIPCTVVGLYQNGTNHIWIDAEWLGRPGAKYTVDSFLIHELTHWLQDRAKIGTGDEDCDNGAYELESEAYDVQNQYQHIFEHKGPEMDLPVPPMCGHKSWEPPAHHTRERPIR